MIVIIHATCEDAYCEACMGGGACQTDSLEASTVEAMQDIVAAFAGEPTTLGFIEISEGPEGIVETVHALANSYGALLAVGVVV